MLHKKRAKPWFIDETTSKMMTSKLFHIHDVESHWTLVTTQPLQNVEGILNPSYFAIFSWKVIFFSKRKKYHSQFLVYLPSILLFHFKSKDNYFNSTTVASNWFTYFSNNQDMTIRLPINIVQDKSGFVHLIAIAM